MSNYDPRSISQMYEQYGKTHGGSSSSGSTYDEVPQTIKQGLGTPLNQSFNTGSDDDDDKPNETKSFFENVFSWFNASGAEPRKPERYDGSSLYSRDEFKPIKYDPSTNTTSVTGYDPGTPMRSGDDIMTDVDAMLDRSDDAGYTPDPALGSTYDEVKDQNRPPVTVEDAISSAIENTIPTEGYKVQRGDTLSEIAAATGRTVKELQQLNNITDPRKMQAGSTLKIPVQTAQDKEIVAGATKMSDLKPLRTANQSMMTGDQREYAPETGFEGMGPDPSTGQEVRGLMSPEFDTDIPAFGVNSREFNDDLLTELVDLEGRGGDFLSSTPTYDLGITESKANEYDLDPDDYETFGQFAADFTDKYVDEKYEENKNIFAKVDAENHTALMSYLWNLGSFGTNQTEALNNNDMRGYIAETKDAVGSEGYSSSGLSARRAKEANMIGENLDNWNPITKVKITGTRANPTFTWEDADGNVVEQYSTTRSLHPANVPDKPNASDVLDEEIVL